MHLDNSCNFRKIHDKLTSSGVVTPDCLRTLASQGYEVVINLMPDESEYAIYNEQTIVESQKIEYIYMPVYFNRPKYSDFIKFSYTMDRVSKNKVHMHCAANYRVSVFYALYATVHDYWSLNQAWEFIHDVWQPEVYSVWSEFISDISSINPDTQHGIFCEDDLQ